MRSDFELQIFNFRCDDWSVFWCSRILKNPMGQHLIYSDGSSQILAESLATRSIGFSENEIASSVFLSRKIRKKLKVNQTKSEEKEDNANGEWTPRKERKNTEIHAPSTRHGHERRKQSRIPQKRKTKKKRRKLRRGKWKGKTNTATSRTTRKTRQPKISHIFSTQM